MAQAYIITVPPVKAPGNKVRGGEEFGFLIGSYGKGNGQKKVWGYYDENNQLVLTRGVKATMPVLKAEQKIIEDYKNVVKRVFE